MNESLRLSILLLLMASGACGAAESMSCQPQCAEDKRECRALGQPDGQDLHLWDYQDSWGQAWHWE